MPILEYLSRVYLETISMKIFVIPINYGLSPAVAPIIAL